MAAHGDDRASLLAKKEVCPPLSGAVRSFDLHRRHQLVELH